MRGHSLRQKSKIFATSPKGGGKGRCRTIEKRADRSALWVIHLRSGTSMGVISGFSNRVTNRWHFTRKA